MKLKALVLGIAVTVGLATVGRAEAPGVPPGIVVGIGQFVLGDMDDPCHLRLLLVQKLVLFGFETRELETSTDPAAALSSTPGMHYLVTGSVVQGGSLSATARLVSRDGGAPQSFSATGPGACEDIATQVVQYLGSQHAIGRHVTAERTAAERRLAEDPNDFRSLFLLGLVQRFAGNWSEALSYFSRAEDVRPQDAQVHFNLALCYKATGADTSWLHHLQEAQGLDRGNESVAIAQGNYYLAHRQFDRGIGQYERCLDSPTVSSLARWNLAVLHQREGNLAKALVNLGEIPKSSLLFEEARAWSSRLEKQEQREKSLFGPRTSFWSWLKLEEFGLSILGVTLALLLGAFLPSPPEGKSFEIGPIKIPALPSSARKWLRIVAPVLLVGGILLFVPWIPVSRLGLDRPSIEASHDLADAFEVPAARH